MEKIHEHLLGRPFEPIFRTSNEKENEMALKVMCIIDYFIEKRGLNAAIDAVPKLREQLLRWSSFESFRFYSYSAPNNWFKHEVLQCKRCEFIGPYLTVLTHMAVNHDLHIGLKKCAWCNRSELQLHMSQRTSQECYEMYLAKEQIKRDPKYPNVVVDFYNMLKSIGVALEVKIKRSESFAGIGYKSKDYLLDADVDVDQSILVYSAKRKRKEINTMKLNDLFRQAMVHFHGSDAPKFYNAFANKRYADTLKSVLGSDARAYQAMKTSPKCTPAKSCPPPESSPRSPPEASSNVSQAFASYIAMEVDLIQSPDVKRRTKRMIQDIIANGQDEDKNTTN